ncbi:TniB family NTP-binding protein [Nocardia zapadnayensis]|nr:TniB family NTP-binding protein [Nocardia zapadnayensis]MCX0270048.1 TniB family NTP-binding protein [Nocardia zapadnayensis]
MNHPIFSAEPHDKEEWRTLVFWTPPPPPVMPSYAEYKAMSETDKRRFNRSRSAHHSALVLVETDDVKQFHYELDRRLEANHWQPAGARRGKVIDAPATMGKSTLIKWFAVEFERQLRIDEPDRFVTDEGNQYIRDYVPVVYISIGADDTPKDLSAAIARFLMLPIRSGATKSAITDQVIKAMRICGTELVIFDEFHHLDVTLKEGKVASEHIKHLANHTPATFVYLGSNLKTSALFLEAGARDRATPLAGRTDLYTMTAYKIDNREQIEQWARVVAAFEDALCLFEHLPYSLTRIHWRYLHDRTGGSIASLSHLIRESAIEAVRNADEAITVGVMDRIRLDQRAQEHYDSIRNRARRRPRSGTDGASPTQ